MDRSSRRRRAGVTVAVLLPLLVVALGGLSLQLSAAQDAAPTPSPTPGVLATPAAEPDCATDVGVAAPLAGTEAQLADTYTIVSEESAARYRAQEELASVGATEAVGETKAIIGQILFDTSGLPMACSRFDVDLRTLQSDSARRDNYLYGNTLETEQFPLATFVLTEVRGLEGPLVDGEETAFTLVGNLTVHGVTRIVAWEATATRDGDSLQGSAATVFEMPDFAIEPPVVGPVVSLDETVRLEVDLSAERAA